MGISFVRFSVAVIRKIWALQKKNRIFKKTFIFCLVANFFIFLWWYATTKYPIMLLLAPTVIKQETVGIAQKGTRKVVEELAGVPAAFGVTSAVWAPHCDNSSFHETSPPLLLLVIVANTAQNSDKDGGAHRRHAIRRGWAAPQVPRYQPFLGNIKEREQIKRLDGVRVLFFTGPVNGLSTKANNSRRRLQLEMQTWEDIVQLPLGADDAPAAYQHTLALKWMHDLCPSARYLVKVDDDVLVNLPDLVHMLTETLPRRGASGLLLCLTKCPTRRFWRMDGWLVPPIDKPCYCNGKAALYSNDVALAIYDQVLHARRFPKKEAQLTGLLRVRANVSLLPLETRSLGGDAPPEALRSAVEEARVPCRSQSDSSVPSKDEPSHSRVLFAHQPSAVNEFDWLWSQAVSRQQVLLPLKKRI